MVSLEIDSQPDVPKGLTLYIISSYNVNDGNYMHISNVNDGEL